VVQRHRHRHQGQVTRIGVTANIRLVDTSWLINDTQDARSTVRGRSRVPLDRGPERLLSITTGPEPPPPTDPRSTSITPATRARWIRPSARHRQRVQDSPPTSLRNTISARRLNQVAQPWMKGYVYQAEFKVHYKKVWLDNNRCAPTPQAAVQIVPNRPHDHPRGVVMIDRSPVTPSCPARGRLHEEETRSRCAKRTD